MHIYHLKTCDTCRKAIKALAAHAPELTDVRADGVPTQVLEALLAEFGPETLLNRKSTTWRSLSDAEKTRAPLALLQEHPTLMKRPVIVTDHGTYVGWTKDVQSSLDVG